MDTESHIVNTVIDALLAAGYKINVNDGEETVLIDSTNKEQINAALRSTDLDYLIARKDDVSVGWVMLIWGNDQDVVSDYSVSLSGVMDPLIEELAA